MKRESEVAVLNVMGAWERTTEDAISAAEMAMLQTDPWCDARHMLYILRISKMAPRVKNIVPLATRWNLAFYGEGGTTGLYGCEQTELRNLLEQFLRALFELALIKVINAELARTEKKLRGQSDRRRRESVVSQCVGELKTWPEMFVPQLACAKSLISKAQMQLWELLAGLNTTSV